jgi:methanogenic corrinoid protein MtbC1
MSQLHHHVFRTTPCGRRLVATCVHGEQHEIGLRMVADFFELEGWDSVVLGAGTPAADLQQALRQHDADALAISVTMSSLVSAVTQIIADVRRSEAGQRVAVLVGGYPFLVSPGLWRQVGADGTGRDGQAAVDAATALVDARHRGDRGRP